MRVGIVVFPGSNCDRDCARAVAEVSGRPAAWIWHKDRDLGGADLVIVPGGFSYGDYLRCGAIARFSPVMEEVVAFARRGGPVIGICNGFQILTEAGLLPGALMRNVGLKFICQDVHLSVGDTGSPLLGGYRPGQVVRMPVAHADGRFHADAETLSRIEGEGRVAFRYCDAEGRVGGPSNPNGSLAAIAGIVSPGGNVLGMMPHPERAAEAILGGTDGRALFVAALSRAA
ncbi:phosphoribosylformylglycinamidine synthase subunit PurQ [Myxococcota bacterium]|nr:phosphoribosylformylglycinamidine synthase subunit PurQ [Myxococcota bacterium]